MTVVVIGGFVVRTVVIRMETGPFNYETARLTNNASISLRIFAGTL